MILPISYRTIITTMRNILLILFFFVSLLAPEYTQAQVVLKTDTVEIPCTSSSTLFVPFKVENFNNVGGLQFTMTWNPAELAYQFVGGTSSSNELSKDQFTLYQNQPNPFNESTTIGFVLPESGRATLRIYSVSGQLAQTHVGRFEKGYNSVTLQKSDFASGVYWYELKTQNHSDRKKMILID